jgi:hypothetical protein
VVEGPVAGFVENSSDPDDLQAWCAACEELFIREGEMTEAFRAFNDMKVVCDALNRPGFAGDLFG